MSIITFAQTRCSNSNCKREYRVRDEHIGKTATCKNCGQVFTLAPVNSTQIGLMIPEPQPRQSTPNSANRSSVEDRPFEISSSVEHRGGDQGIPMPNLRLAAILLFFLSVIGMSIIGVVGPSIWRPEGTNLGFALCGLGIAGSVALAAARSIIPTRARLKDAALTRRFKFCLALYLLWLAGIVVLGVTQSGNILLFAFGLMFCLLFSSSAIYDGPGAALAAQQDREGGLWLGIGLIPALYLWIVAWLVRIVVTSIG